MILVSIGDAAHFTGRSQSAIRAWLSKGVLTRHPGPRPVDYDELGAVNAARKTRDRPTRVAC